MNLNTKIKQTTFSFSLFALITLIVNSEAPCQVPLGYFTDVVPLGPNVNSGSEEAAPNISADGLTLYFTSNRGGGYGDFDIWQATRPTLNDDFGSVTNIGPGVNSSSGEFKPIISFDGLTLYFRSPRGGGFGSSDIYQATRSAIDDTFGDITNLGPGVNSGSDDRPGYITPDGLTFYFMSTRPDGYGGFDIYVATRETVDDPFDNAINLGSSVNSPGDDYGPRLSLNRLILFFSDFYTNPRSGGEGGVDLWVATRESTEEPFGRTISLNQFSLGSAVNGPHNEFNLTLSQDWPASGSELFFQGFNRPGGQGGGDIWQATWIAADPFIDFDGSGIVDMPDLLRMIRSWGQEDPYVDIAPSPYTDGTVDVLDLQVLMNQWQQEVDDPTLLAHWPLDETEGIVVSENVGGNQAYVVGDAVWQPDGGNVDGALLFDGVDDCISAPAVLNPADGPFSVLAWIKGGGPGQGIISEQAGPYWLSLNPTTGYLMTELASIGRSGVPLSSQTAIDDGNWHRIGLVWDGSNRILSVDNTVAAQDTQDDLQSAGSSLYIGCGAPLLPETFFSGMIDDVRIYTRAVKP